MSANMEFVDVKARTKHGAVIHYGFKTVEEVPRVELYCLSGRTHMPIEVPSDTEVTCKWCAPLKANPHLLAGSSGNWHGDVSLLGEGR